MTTTRGDARPLSDAPTGGEHDPLWHKMRRGADRYLCGRPRLARFRGLPSQGGSPNSRRIMCPVCETIYLNLML